MNIQAAFVNASLSAKRHDTIVIITPEASGLAPFGTMMAAAMSLGLDGAPVAFYDGDVFSDVVGATAVFDFNSFAAIVNKRSTWPMVVMVDDDFACDVVDYLTAMGRVPLLFECDADQSRLARHAARMRDLQFQFAPYYSSVLTERLNEVVHHRYQARHGETVLRVHANTFVGTSATVGSWFKLIAYSRVQNVLALDSVGIYDQHGCHVTEHVFHDSIDLDRDFPVLSDGVGCKFVSATWARQSNGWFAVHATSSMCCDVFQNEGMRKEILIPLNHPYQTN